MRLIDADELSKVKFHPLPYTHIVPADLLEAQTEAYERGWNDAIDAIIENAETIEPQQWIPVTERLPKVKEQPYYEDEHQVLRESEQILIWAKMPSTGKFGYAIGSLITDDGEEKGHQWNGIFDDLDEIDPYHPEWVVAWMPLPSPYKEVSE